MAIFNNDNAVAITPSDTDDLSVLIKRLYIGVTGAIKIDTASGDTVTFVAVPVGVFDPGCRIKRVYSTGTAAGSIIGIY
ncbi:hypothetical protein KAR91_03230 [Candidatus Pacearchaeota archaeon]|nr:hypothetical protein [Candidatus Pacearchaeota archaeon]